MAPSVSEVKSVDAVASDVANLKLANAEKTDNVRTEFSFSVTLPYTHSQRALRTPCTTPTSTTLRNSLLSKSSVCTFQLSSVCYPLTPSPEFSDKGLLADKAKPNLLNENTKISHLSPYLGTEISGVQISQLSEAGLNELALYTAERKVLIFRDQDFKDLSPERQIAIARHFGRTHQHPTDPNVKGYPEFHVVYRDGETANRLSARFAKYFAERSNFTSWHSDVSYEKQPPSTTFFFVLDQVRSRPFLLLQFIWLMRLPLVARARR